MTKEIAGLKTVYLDALRKRDENMMVPANLVAELIEQYSELQTAVIDLKTGLQTCQNASNAIMEQYKDL